MSDSSSDEQPAVKKSGTERLVRRWEDKLVGILGAAVIALVCWMWTGLSGQITRLEEARVKNDTTIAVQNSEIGTLKDSMIRIEMKLDHALKIDSQMKK